LEKGTPQQVKYSLFERINTGGLELKSQEIRHALNQEHPEKPEINPAKYIRELSQVDAFVKIWGGKPKKRMQDRETVLRYVAFKIATPSNYSPDMKDFLDIMMTEIYNTSKYRLKQIKEGFELAVKLAKFLFGTTDEKFNAFFRISEKGDSIFSNALFEALTYHLSNLSKNEVSLLRKNKNLFLNDYDNLLNEASFLEAISDKQTNIESVLLRFKNIGELIKKYSE
jgi:hypothetical protein